MTIPAEIAALLAHFGMAPFTRLQARKVGLEPALAHAETAGAAKFVRCIGYGGGVYRSDNELYRMVA